MKNFIKIIFFLLGLGFITFHLFGKSRGLIVKYYPEYLQNELLGIFLFIICFIIAGVIIYFLNKKLEKFL